MSDLLIFGQVQICHSNLRKGLIFFIECRNWYVTHEKLFCFLLFQEYVSYNEIIINSKSVTMINERTMKLLFKQDFHSFVIFDYFLWKVAISFAIQLRFIYLRWNPESVKKIWETRFDQIMIKSNTILKRDCKMNAKMAKSKK